MATSLIHGATTIMADSNERRYSLATDDGEALVTMSERGFIADIPVLRSVGLLDLCEVQSHEIVRVAGLVSHLVRFVGGGCVRFAHNHRGELVELSGERIRLYCDGIGQVQVGEYRPDAAAPAQRPTP